MNTKSGCGRLDLSAFQGGAARPAWAVDPRASMPVEPATWRPVELERADIAPMFEPRPN